MISAGVKSNIHQHKNKRSSSCILQIIIRSTWKLQIQWAIPEKKAKKGVQDIPFWKPPWKFSFIYFTPGNSRQIKAPYLKIVQNCITSLGNSNTNNQDPCKFHIIFSWSPTPVNSAFYFFDSPWNSISSTSHCLFFSGIAQCKEGAYFLLSSFDFGWYFIHFDFVLSLRTGGRGGGRRVA